MTDLDDALTRFQQTDPEYLGGLANHGPMVVEALARLGHGSLIDGFVDIYAPRLPVLLPGKAITPAEQSAAYGDTARMSDWRETFVAELAARPWRDVLGEWLEPLLPGLFAGAGHGLLRTAHAVRSLEADETAPRTRELAFGLGYWAARYQELPGTPGARAEAGCGPVACFDGARVVPTKSRAAGFFFDAVRVLEELPEEHASFVLQVERFDPSCAAPGDLLHALCVVAAERYLANPQARVAYVHCLTVPAAVRLLAPHLGPEATQRAIGFALQAALALHVVSAGEGSVEPTAEVSRLAEDPAEIRYRAACSLEAHAIKFVEACLREHAIGEEPVLCLAAADAAVHLNSGQGRGASC